MPSTNNNSQEKVTIAYLVNEVAKFARGKTTEEDLNQIGEKISVRSYIPMMEKFQLSMLLAFNINNETLENTEIKAMAIQKHLFFDVLLGSYAMIDVSETNLCTYESFDLLYPVLAPYILQFCQSDYNMITDMIRDSINFSNIQEMGEVMNKLDYEKLAKATNDQRKAIEELQKNKDMIAELNKLIENNNPMVKQTKDVIDKIALEQAN